MSTVRIGDVIVLVEARGCWTVHTITGWDVIDGATFVRAGAAWRRLRFVRRAAEVNRHGRPVFRCAEPAIGPAARPFCDLYLPEGWHPPSVCLEPVA